MSSQWAFCAPQRWRAREDFSHRGRAVKGRTDHHFHPARPLEPVAHGEGELPAPSAIPRASSSCRQRGSPHQAASSRAATPGSGPPLEELEKGPPAVEM